MRRASALLPIALWATAAGAQHHHHPAPAPTSPRASAGAPAANAADWIWGADAMRASRAALARDHGGATFARVTVELAEVAFADHTEGFRWDLESEFGGDEQQLVLETEGEGSFGERVEAAEVQALWQRAIGPAVDARAGVRQVFGRGRDATEAALGIEGEAPFWLEVEAMAYLSTDGDLTARLEAHHDARITQRLILEPRVELGLAAQDASRRRLGAGLSDAELGLRLRYEIVPEFAPYVGVSHEATTGATRRLLRRLGDEVEATAIVAGVRFWF